jgi:type III secretory pathway component EscS
MVFPLIPIIVALIVAGLILWAITQFPLDPTITKLIRVVVVVVAVLYVVSALFGADLGVRFR